jgi:hypothetical protein
MAEVKLDLTKLKNEIEVRNREKGNKQVAMPRSQDGGIPKNKKGQFLNELVTSMHTGMKTTASETVMTVAQAADKKAGFFGQNQTYAAPQRQQRIQENVMPMQQGPRSGASDWGVPSGNHGGGYGRGNGDYDRDQMFDQNFSQANARYDQMRMGQAQDNPALQKFVQQNQQYMPNQVVTTVQPVQQINEQEYINEKLERNLEKLVESSFKSVLTNFYTKERIQESLVEFLQTDEGLKVVSRAITEIAKRSKQNQIKK